MLRDSPAVLAIKEELSRGHSESSRKRIHKRIRNQRLLEARERGTHTEDDWEQLLCHFNYRCVKCGCYPEGRPCKDHIVPICDGGSDGLDNLQPMCRECNTGKRSDTFNWAAYRDEYGFESN
jgi:5-methylcytosine-specific restriction endonuclease McrA